MAKLELVSLAAERQAQNLVAETDAEDRLFSQELLHVFFCVRHGVGISRAIGEENPVGIQLQDILRRRSSGNDFHAAAGFGKAAENVALNAVVVSDDEKTRPLEARMLGLAASRGRIGVFSFAVTGAKLPASLVPIVRRAAAHLFDEVTADESWRGFRFRDQCAGIVSERRDDRLLRA